MISKKLLRDLKGYQIVGKHSAVKACLWLKKSMRNLGYCYKQKFYGIKSHRCLQMTPALICNQSCIHCWRPVELLNQVEKWDLPEFIAEESIKAQRRILTGFKGTSGVDEKKLREAHEPNHVAISLIGEPTLYPYLDKLVEIYKAKGMTTFVVTNGTNPEMIEKIEPYQLYISLLAYDEKSHLILNRPKQNYWKNIMKSLEIMAEKKYRTVIRLTAVKGYNMKAGKFAPLISKTHPMFIEVKAYMHLGYSRYRLPPTAMPKHSEVLEYSREIAKLTDYEIADESEISRVVLLKRK